METPRIYNITLPTETKQGRRIRVYDYRTGYIRWCAICELRKDSRGDDDHGDRDADHAFIESPKDHPPCPHCTKPVDPDYHFGVYFNRVAYVMFDSRLCAYEFDITTIEDA